MGIVDRIENGIVVLELDGDILNLKRDLFPDNLKEGDVVQYKDGQFVIMIEETDQRKKSIDDLFNSLLKED